MFRELIRKGQKLSIEKCIHILTSEKRGVLSVNGDNGYPYGMPMNHYYNQDDGKIYFHCGNFGHRLDSINRNSKASFCVYDNGFCNAGEWALNVNSVIVFGNIQVIDDTERIIDITTKLSYKFTNQDDYIKSEIEHHAHKTLLLVLTPEHICGKTVQES